MIADTAVTERPTAEQYAAIAMRAASFARRMGQEPRVAFISYTTFGNPPGRHIEELRDAVKVDVLAVERRLVDLEVAGVHDHAARRLDRQRDAVRHAVRDAQELDHERSDRDAIARLDPRQPALRLFAGFFELVLDQGERERRAVDRPLDVRQHVRHGADVILVAVGEDQGGDGEAFERPEVRDDQVHAEQLRLRERDAGINEDRGVAAGDHHHVHAELADAAERNDLERRVDARGISRTHALEVNGIPATQRRCATCAEPQA